MLKYSFMLKRLLPLLVFVFLPALILNAQQKVIQLYEGAAPGSEGWTWNEGENDKNMWQTKVVYNVAKPTLSVFMPEGNTANGTAVIICPGGAFYALSINSEGYDVAKWLTKKGVTCFVLKYRLVHVATDDPTAEVMRVMGKPEFEEKTGKVIPLSIADGKAAVAYVRKHAAEYNVASDRIGIMGFSAGGTVAASAAFNYTKENRPDFVAPVYAFFPTTMHGTVADDAPPMFIAAASDDQLNLAPHSADLYDKWLSSKKPVELHMYARGGHGFGMRTQNLPSDSWIDRFGEWLNVQGYLKKPAVNPAFAPYQRREFELAAGKTLPYRILFPDNYDKTKKYPLVVFLHGGGERGTDNEKQLAWGADIFLKEENRKNFPAIVIFPQCPQNSPWPVSKVEGNTQPLKISFDYAAEPNWALAAANELVKKLSTEEAVDKSRIYITGLSLGGMGTFESVYRYPDLYAAALPICAGGDVNRYDKRVVKTKFWIFHGTDDAVVDVKLSREMVDKLKSLKADVKYNEYPGVNHDSWKNAFAEPDYLSWMFKQKRKK